MWTNRIALISLAHSQALLILYVASVPVYFSAFTGNNCSHPRIDGQAELTWVAGLMQRRFTCTQYIHHSAHTHRSTNWDRHRATILNADQNQDVNTMQSSQVLHTLLWLCVRQ